MSFRWRKKRHNSQRAAFRVEVIRKLSPNGRIAGYYARRGLVGSHESLTPVGLGIPSSTFGWSGQDYPRDQRIAGYQAPGRHVDTHSLVCSGTSPK